MKKLLALVVVLAMAGMANAGLQYQIDGINYDGGVANVTSAFVTVSLVNTADQAAAFEIGGLTLLGDAAFVNGAVNAPNLPGSWSVVNYGVFEGYGEVFGITYEVPAVAPTKAGKLFEFTFEFKPGGQVATIQMVDGNWAGMANPLEVRIPEPMTLTLLGLGALVLRRRS